MEKTINYCETNIIPIGRVGENDFRSIKINISNIIAELPNAVFKLIVQRNGDLAPYEAEASVLNGFLVWNVSNIDTAKKGYGKAEILAYSGDVVAKSFVYTFVVNESLDPTGPVPEPLQSWYDDIMQASAEVAENTLIVKGYKEETEAFRNETETFRNQAETAKSEAVTAKNNAINAKNDAIIAMNAAETAQSKAEEAQIKAEIAEANAEVSATSANTSANTATTKAEEAEQSATRAEESATQIEASAEQIEINRQNIELKADKTALEKTDARLARTDRSLEYLWKKSKGVIYDSEIIDENSPEITIPSGAMEYAELQMLGGMSGKWNHLIRNGRFDMRTIWESVGGRYAVDSNVCLFTVTDLFAVLYQSSSVPEGHKIFLSRTIKSDVPIVSRMSFGSNDLYPIFESTEEWRKNSIIVTKSNSDVNFNVIRMEHVSTFTTVYIKDVVLIDLTAIFGSGNEPTSTDDPKIKMLEAYAEAHPEYNEGEIISALVDKMESKGRNLWDIDNPVSFGSSGKIIQASSLDVGKTYTFSFTRIDGGSDIRMGVYSDTVRYPSMLRNGNIYYLTLTVQPNDRRYEVYSNENVIANGYLQIEEGITATPFAPYFSTEYPIPEAVQALDGYGIGVNGIYNSIERNGDRWEYHKRVGSIKLEEAYQSTVSPGLYNMRAIERSFASRNYNLITASVGTYTGGHSTGANIQSLFNSNGSNLFVNSGSVSFYLGNQKYATWTEYIAKHGDDLIYYELANEEVTDITDMFTDEDWNILQIEAGGTVQFHYPKLDDGYELAMPSRTEIMVEVSGVV